MCRYICRYICTYLPIGMLDLQDKKREFTSNAQFSGWNENSKDWI